MTPFQDKQIRSGWDSASQKRWFSVVDICAAIRNCDYQSARNYWKWLKAKLTKGQPVSTYTQLKMQSLDGKLRYTDVIDAEGVLLLIELFPTPKAKNPNVDYVKEWVAALVKGCKDPVKQVEEAAKAAKTQLQNKVGNMLKTIRKIKFNVANIQTTPNENFKERFCNTNIQKQKHEGIMQISENQNNWLWAA